MKKVRFLFSVDKNIKDTIVTQIYEKIKKDILNSEIKYGDMLPSIRSASCDLQVSKTSIISAYLQLVTEGFIENIPQKGYLVCKIDAINKETLSFDLEFREKNISYINDSIDKNSFSRSLWKKYYNNVILDENVDLTNLGDEQGELELRIAIANFVRTYRGSNCSPEQIVIASGIQTLLQILIRTTNTDYTKAVLEYPCYKKVEYVFLDQNYEIKNLPVEENGISINMLENVEKALIYVSPSHQYPLGKVMSIDKRLELILHAKNKNCLIIEDDYASIIRYESKPISSLQGLDNFGNTVYLGSFSKTFLPSLRISFMILPQKYVQKYYEIKSRYTHTTSKIEQLALAKFISDGQMHKHMKRINNIYRQKNTIISNYIKKNYPNRLFIENSDSGFHFIFKCKTKRDISFLEEFKDEFLAIDIISFEKEDLTFLFSYSGLENEEIPYILDKMVKILHI
ncbi:MAG: PLP-dependent aminotransferase family protein [Clostridia bacterium]